MNSARPLALAVALGVVAAGLAACGSASHAQTGSAAGAGETSISIQLNWNPDTQDTGIFVAQAKGYYKDAGLTVNVLPYSDTSQDTIVSSGKATCAVTYGSSLVASVAAGAKETAVMALYQHDVNELMVLDDSRFESPADLGGTNYGGFGIPGETIEINDMIKNAGGSGSVKDVVLNTAAYDALYAHKVDSTTGYASWDTIEAEDRGIKIRTWKPQDYGIPDMYTIVLGCNNDWLAANPAVAKKFVAATAEGYQDAIKDPKGSADILMAANPQSLTNKALVYASADYLAKNDYADADGNVGCQSADVYSKYAAWLVGSGQLADASGHVLHTAPPAQDYFTTKFEPSACASE